MPKRSLFNQLNQARGSVNYEDLLTYHEVLAETAGRSYLSGTLAVVSGSATVTDSSNAFQREEQNNFIVVDEGPAAGVYQITASGTLGTFDASVTPVPTGTDATASYRRHYYQNLEDDLNYLRTMLNLVIGENNWYDEPNTDLKNMAYLVPKTPNEVGDNTQYVGIRSGDVNFTISDIDQLAYVVSDTDNNIIAASEYTDNTTSINAGDQVRFTDDNTMAITIPGGFYPADQGVLRIMRDGAVVGELDLAAAWTSDGCSYEETEDDVGDNPNHTSTHTGTDIIDLTNRRCMNTTVDGYPSFWPPYQIASMGATLTLPLGFAGQISVVHSLGGSENYTYSSFFVDTSSQTLSPTAPSFSQNSATTRYLSGVPYYTTGSVFDISITHNTAIFNRGYVSNPLTLNLSEFNASNQTPTLTNLGLADPMDVEDTIGTYDSATVTVGAGNFRDMDVRGTATFRGPFGTANSASSAAGTFRIDSYGQTSDGDTENFDDEVWRFDGTEDFTDTSIDSTDSTWDSTNNVLTTSGIEDGLVVYNGTLKYPTLNHSSGFLPAGPDYSSASGDKVYYRVFTASGAFTNGSITFSGWSNALSVVQGSNVEVYLRYPNCTDYGNGNNGSVWQDLSVDQTTYGGDGCLGTGSSGSSVAFSFGTTSSVTYGNRIIMKLVFKNSSATALTGISFNPTL
jgi:hypothetical protein